MRDPRRLSQDPNAGELGRALREAGELGSRERVSSAWQRLQPALDRVPADPIDASTGLSALAKGALLAGALAIGTVAWLLFPVGTAPNPPLPSATAPAAAPIVSSPPAVSFATPTSAPQSHPQPQPQPLAPESSVPVRPSPRPVRASRATPLERAPAPIAVVAALPDPEGELALLTRAQEKLEVAPAAALALLVEHEQRYASGVLVQEREVMRIDAERALGRSESAAARARAFLARFPRSPQRTRLQTWLSTRSQGDVSAAEADKP